ncbi:MFS transporter [Actinopolymorpha sp. B9G3]|uniref:MFS transporter n=1 Tax=Actinopolymorpha sp. B9G3 TaxID=3158970 RepID=UPI0032D9A1F5
MTPTRVSYGWWIVAALALTTTAGYGVLAYAFAVFLVPMQADLHASRTALTVAPALSLLTSAAVAVPVGRWLDRSGGRRLMVLSSVLATGCLLAWSRVENVVALYAVFVGLGVAAAGVLYEAAFAVVVTWFHGQRRGTAILAITIVGGFASTIFLPLSGLLVEFYGWRQALVVLAVIYGAVTVPLHLVVRRPLALVGADEPGSGGTPSIASQSVTGSDARTDRASTDRASTDRASTDRASTDRASTDRASTDRASTDRAGTERARTDRANADQDPADRRSAALRTAFGDPAYWLIAVSFVAQGIGTFVISVHVVAYLTELGHAPTTAATVAGLLGVLSVTGRVVTTAVSRRVRLTAVVAAIFVLQAMGTLLLPWVGDRLVGAIACVLAVGIGFGVGTIARPALVADRYGVAAYATLSGLLAAFLMVTKAAAPLGAAWLHAQSGTYTGVMMICTATSVLGAVGLVAVGRRPA